METYVLGLHFDDRPYCEVAIPAPDSITAESMARGRCGYINDVEILGTLESGGDWRDAPIPFEGWTP